MAHHFSLQDPDARRPGRTRIRDRLYARVAELADALDLGSNGATLGGSTPPSRIEGFSLDTKYSSEMKLEVSVKELAPCEKILSVNVAQEDIREEYEVAYREIGRVAKVPGFRPGKAPREQILLHYKSEAKEEVLRKLVSKSLKQALQEKAIDPILNPEIRDLNFTDEKLTYEARIETRPEVKLGNYVGIKVKKNPVHVEDGEIDQVIEKLREGYAKFIPVEDRGLEFGDFMIADLKVIVDGKDVESRQDDWIEFREKGFVPEFSLALKGVKPGTEKEIEVNFPSDYARKEVAGRKGFFKVKIKEIKRRELPQVDLEWAREVGDYKSLEEFREGIKKDLIEQKETQEEHRLQNEVLESLLKLTAFEVPKGVIERRLNHLVEDTVKNMVYQGFKQDDILKQKDEIRKKLQPEAEKQVRLSFIVDKIADQEKIEVTDAELDARFQEIANQVKQPREKVIAYYEAEDLVSGLALQILNQKVVKFLRGKAEII